MFSSLMTENVSSLIKKIENSPNGKPVIIKEMTDPQKLKVPGGACIYYNPDDFTIYLDPPRATEFAIAHELMHAMLYCERYPIVSFPDLLEETFGSLFDFFSLNTVFDHVIFDPMLQGLGYDTGKYKIGRCGFSKLPKDEPGDGKDILSVAVNILELLLYGDPYKEKVKQNMNHYPKTLKLASQLAKRAEPIFSGKAGIRKAKKDCLLLINNWLSSMNADFIDILIWFGVSPLFTDFQLKQPASEVIDYRSYQTVLSNKKTWIGAFQEKGDKIHFNNLAWHCDSEHDDIKSLREKWASLTLKELLLSENVYFGQL